MILGMKINIFRTILIRKTMLLIPGNDNFSPRNDNCCPRNDNFHPRNDIFCPWNDTFCPWNENLTPRNETFRPRTGDFRRRNETLSPRNGEFSSEERWFFIPGTVVFRPRMGILVPGTGFAVPERRICPGNEWCPGRCGHEVQGRELFWVEQMFYGVSDVFLFVVPSAGRILRDCVLDGLSFMRSGTEQHATPTYLWYSHVWH